MSRTHDWSDQDHLDLVADRDRGLGWKKCRPLVVPAQVKAGRYKLLKSGVTAKVGSSPAKKGWDPDEDGLLRLIKRKQLTLDLANQAVRLRALHRMAELAGGAVKLTNLDGTGGSTGMDLPSDGDIGAYLRAKQELFSLRWLVLRGEPDMLAVIDGVVIGGQTLLALAGGDAHRSRQLLCILRVALNLLHLASRPPVKPGVHEHA